MKHKKRRRNSYNPLLWLAGCILAALLLQSAPSDTPQRPEMPSESLSASDTPSWAENNDMQEGASIPLEDASGPVAPTDFSKDMLAIHFLDVGQGDCTLVLCGGEAMLIDAGDNYQGTKIQNYLQKQGVEHLKYVIGTHPDADHIGGLDVILYKFDCETVVMPAEEKDTPTYRDVIDTMKEKGYTSTLPVVGDSYALGNASFTILSPAREYPESNNNSVALLLTHGDNTFLFTGDAEGAAEEDMLGCGISLDADVYHVGHHGSSTSSSQAFLEAVSPAYAVISCGAGNEYGHPHAETLEKLDALGAEVYRTDEQGAIVLTSDGQSLTFQTAR